MRFTSIFSIIALAAVSVSGAPITAGELNEAVHYIASGWYPDTAISTVLAAIKSGNAEASRLLATAFEHMPPKTTGSMPASSEAMNLYEQFQKVGAKAFGGSASSAATKVASYTENELSEAVHHVTSGWYSDSAVSTLLKASQSGDAEAKRFLSTAFETVPPKTTGQMPASEEAMALYAQYQKVGDSAFDAAPAVPAAAENKVAAAVESVKQKVNGWKSKASAWFKSKTTAQAQRRDSGSLEDLD